MIEYRTKCPALIHECRCPTAISVPDIKLSNVSSRYTFKLGTIFTKNLLKVSVCQSYLIIFFKIFYRRLALHGKTRIKIEGTSGSKFLRNYVKHFKLTLSFSAHAF